MKNRLILLVFGLGIRIFLASQCLPLGPWKWHLFMMMFLNITWLQDANLAATNTFGVEGIVGLIATINAV